MLQLAILLQSFASGAALPVSFASSGINAFGVLSSRQHMVMPLNLSIGNAASSFTSGKSLSCAGTPVSVFCLNVNVSETAASRALASWRVLAGFNVSKSFVSCASLEECASMGLNSQTRSFVSELRDADILKGQSDAWCSDVPQTDRSAIPTSSDNHPHVGSEFMSDARNPPMPQQLSSMSILSTGVVSSSTHKSKSFVSLAPWVAPATANGVVSSSTHKSKSFVSLAPWVAPATANGVVFSSTPKFESIDSPAPRLVLATARRVVPSTTRYESNDSQECRQECGSAAHLCLRSSGQVRPPTLMFLLGLIVIASVVSHCLVSRTISRLDAQALSLAGIGKELASCNMFHMYGLPTCFVPLSEDMRLGMAHRLSENVSPVLTRSDEVLSQPACRDEGGTTLVAEVASLINLEASHQQSQQLTPSYDHPSDGEAEFAQPRRTVYGVGQIAESSRSCSASTLSFLAGMPINVDMARPSHMLPAYLANGFAPNTDMILWYDHHTEEIEAAVPRTACLDPEGSQLQPPIVHFLATAEVTQPMAIPATSSDVTAPCSATSQCFRMQCESTVKHSQTPHEAVPVRSFVSLDSGLTLSQETCTICMNSFGSRDQCCRLVCGHVFHCLCIGELLQHTSQIMEGDIRICCPNCRKRTCIDQSCAQPVVASQKSQMPQQVAIDQPGAMEVQDSTDGAEVSEEHGTPTGSVASPPCSPSDPKFIEELHSSSVGNKESKLNLPIDLGPQDSLVGAVWLYQFLKKLNRKSVTHAVNPQSQPLKVGSVGKGSLNWPEDFSVPLEMPPLPSQPFSKLTGTVQDEHHPRRPDEKPDQDEQHPRRPVEESDPMSHVVSEGSASVSSRADPSKPAGGDDIGSGAQPAVETAASAAANASAAESPDIAESSEWQTFAPAASSTAMEVPVTVAPTTAKGAEEVPVDEMPAHVECAQPPTAEEVPEGVMLAGAGSAGKSADVSSSVPPEEASVFVTPTTEGHAHGTTALELPLSQPADSENTTLAVIPAAEIPGQEMTATEQPPEQLATPEVEKPTEETPASAALEETPNTEEPAGVGPEAVLTPAMPTEESPDARELPVPIVVSGTATAPVSPGSDSSYTEDTDVSIITAMDVLEIPVRPRVGFVELGSSSSETSETEAAPVTAAGEPAPRVSRESEAVPGTARTESVPKTGDDATKHAASPSGSVPAADAGGPSPAEADPPRRVLLVGTRGHTPVVLTPRVDGEVAVTAAELSKAGVPPPKGSNTGPNKAPVPMSAARAEVAQSQATVHTPKVKTNTKEREKPEAEEMPAKKKPRKRRKGGPPGGWRDPPNRPTIEEEPDSSQDEPMRDRIAGRIARLSDPVSSELLRIAFRNEKKGRVPPYSGSRNCRKARAKADASNSAKPSSVEKSKGPSAKKSNPPMPPPPRRQQPEADAATLPPAKIPPPPPPPKRASRSSPPAKAVRSGAVSIKAMPAKPKEEVSYIAEPVPAFPDEKEMNPTTAKPAVAAEHARTAKPAVAAEPAKTAKPAVAVVPAGKAGPKAAESAAASETEFEVIEIEEELEEIVVEEEPCSRRPPLPPKPKRLLPPPEPIGPPPPPKSVRAKAAEANLYTTVSNPYATRTAKRKARREYREATGLEPPKGPY
eukprot:s1838_g4.t1